jgi:hypothetical protein
MVGAVAPLNLYPKLEKPGRLSSLLSSTEAFDPKSTESPSATATIPARFMVDRYA